MTINRTIKRLLPSGNEGRLLLRRYAMLSLWDDPPTWYHPIPHVPYLAEKSKMFRLLILSDPRIEMFSHSKQDLFDQLAVAERGEARFNWNVRGNILINMLKLPRWDQRWHLCRLNAPVGSTAYCLQIFSPPWPVVWESPGLFSSDQVLGSD